MFFVNMKYKYLSDLGVVFVVIFLCYFQRLQLLAVKKIEIIFSALYFCLYELKKLDNFSK